MDTPVAAMLRTASWRFMLDARRFQGEAVAALLTTAEALRELAELVDGDADADVGP